MKDERPSLEAADEEELRSAAALARALEGGADGPDVPRAALEAAALLRLSAGVAELSDERRAVIRHELLAGLPARSERRRRSLLPAWARALPRWSYLALPLAGTAVVCLLLLAKGPEPEASFAERSFGEPKPSVQTSATPPSLAVRQEAAPPGAPDSDRRRARLRAPESVERNADSFALDDSASGSKTAAPREFAAAEGASGIGSIASSDERARRQALPADEARGGSGSAVAAGNLAGAVGQPSARAALVGLDKDVRAERTQLLARSNDAELSRAHAELDGAQSRAELERSQAGLSRLLDTAGDGLDPNDRRQLRQDLYCRLAETALRLGEPRAALEWTRRGIELDGPPSPFLAQLMALEGDALAALGEPSSAAASYMRALHVHEALLDESLDGH